MQFPDVLCYIFLTITVAASCVEADDKDTNELTDTEPGRVISKREAIMVDSYHDTRLYPKPNIIYKRVMQSQRYTSPKTKYGPPRSYYKTNRPPKTHRKPGKKYKRYHKPNLLSSKYLPPNSKNKRNSKPKYGFRSKPRPPSGFHNAPSIPKINTGFGEPPVDYTNDYQAPKQSYGEPPVDSYGAPLSSKADDHDYSRQTYPVWSNDDEGSFAFSKRRPSFAKPETDDKFVKRIPQEYNDEIFFKHGKDKNYFKKKPQHFGSKFSMRKNKPRNVHNEPKLEEEIIVGGQYAEPPARYVARIQHNAPIIDTDDEFSPLYGFVNAKVASPYINYKNSNIAFSPQNLNDAFSLIDK